MTDRTALLSRITQTLGKCGGGPCIRGMRIRVSDILETLADNITPTEIRADIKSVSIGIIPISLLSICVNQRQSLVICG
ncbi:MAG: DUF433 domain-containing protein [Microcoleus sp. Co-bin12]|nr:DUF433 domain-containing protein [Microcoleus sp. Co-bin12]